MPASSAERMKRKRERRRGCVLREVRITVPDARTAAVRRRVAEQVRGLDSRHEHNALAWIEAVSGSGGHAPV